MPWLDRHRESERLAGAAEAAAREGRAQAARELRLQAPPMRTPGRPVSLEAFLADPVDPERSGIFAGRAAELQWLHAQVATMRGMWERRGEVRGSMRTVTGCPGIGKTALLRRFADRCADELLTVEATPDDLRSLEALNERARARVAPALGALPEAELATFRLDAAGRFLGRLAERHGIERHGVLLLLDDAQQVAQGHHDAAIHFLHTGSLGQPVFPFLFGLNGTRDALERAGAPRVPPESRIGLSTLPPEDAAAALRNFERAFSVEAPPDLAQRLLADSRGFPQHLDSALRSLGEEWLRAGRRKDRLDAAAVVHRARALREAYCEGRFGPLAKDPRAAGLVDVANRQGLTVAQLHVAATRAHRDGGCGAKEAEDAATALVAALFRAGALSEGDDGICRTPIPSFLAWIRDTRSGGRRAGPAPRRPSP